MVGCILLPVNSCDLVIHYMSQLKVMLKGKGYAKIFKNVILPFLFICQVFDLPTSNPINYTFVNLSDSTFKQPIFIKELISAELNFHPDSASIRQTQGGGHVGHSQDHLEHPSGCVRLRVSDHPFSHHKNDWMFKNSFSIPLKSDQLVGSCLQIMGAPCFGNRSL